MELYYLIGIDGSGKTTLAQGLVDELQNRGVKASYFYAQHTPILLLPLKWLARRTLIRSTDPSKNYHTYSVRKTETSRRYGKLAKIYALVWLVDYVIATYIRLLPYIFRSRCIIVDRYYIDIVTNISQTLGLSDDEAVRMAYRVSTLFPQPSMILFIDLAEDVAFTRKDDIDSVEYLRERRKRYQALSKDFGFVHLNGELSPLRLREEALQQIESLLPKK